MAPAPQKVSWQQMLHSMLCGTVLCRCVPAVMQMAASQLFLVTVHQFFCHGAVRTSF